MHNGHLKLITKVMADTGCGNGLLIPAGVSPLKTDSLMAGDIHRLNMCRLAAATVDNISVCDLELYMPKPSYSLNTLMALKATRPQSVFHFICGSDAFLSFDKWYKYQDILRLAVICTVARDPGDRAEIEKMAEKMKKDGGRIEICDFEPVTVSSTEIRKLVRNSQSIAGLVPKPVEDYITENMLYQNKAD